MKYWFQMLKILPGQPMRRRFVGGRSQIFGPFTKMLQFSHIADRPGIDLRVGQGECRFDPKIPNSKVPDGADLVFWNGDGWQESYDDDGDIYTDIVVWATVGDEPVVEPQPWTEEFDNGD